MGLVRQGMLMLVLASVLLVETAVSCQIWAQSGGGGTTKKFIVEIDEGSATPGCEVENECYEPSALSVPVGATVIWTNEDAAGHTVTSGVPGDADAGAKFDSTKDPAGFLIKSQAIWQHTFDAAGQYPYFCQVHPWMIGKVTVEGTATSDITINASTQITNFRVGDSVTVSGSVNPVAVKQPVVIQVFNPVGTAFRFDEVTISASGSFTYNFKIEGQLATIGSYRIDIGYFDSKKSLTINVGKSASITTGKIGVSDTGLVDASGSSVSRVFVDQQVLVQSKVGNNQDTTQDYAYIVQIKDSDDIVVSLSWVQGAINAGQSLNVAQSWLPDSSGTYKVQIFVWQSITNPLPLTSTVTELEVNVSA